MFAVVSTTGFCQNNDITMSLSPTGGVRSDFDTLYNLEIVIQNSAISDADSVLLFLKGEVNDYLPNGVNIFSAAHTSTTSQSPVDISSYGTYHIIIFGNVSSDLYELKLIVYKNTQQIIIEKNILEIIVN
ncbi:MAG: hypothetical protein A2W93_09720 [Bacteroidetes bacterium GWF2_43_63]|nr:MAG: hypothetical protein A2W94_07205 [Bacteroidetes bacterium GWE2_42_42]OFY54584.1 MAG: hypothetical protein A2W93_09720 [Bacteroidetes bacterium GWF2_43_63]HBG70605.1 hypothetical protein [Bacteroidales bacterium]HCB60902.1 hypothetical protein [Bacteroidales bacterium]